MSEGFTKLWSSILDSSIWLGRSEMRIVWITLLAMADARGRVEASVHGIAHRAHVPVKTCRDALHQFQQPDPDSKDPEHEGRRLGKVTGGFQVLNYEKYRERQTAGQRRWAERKRQWRETRAKGRVTSEDVPGRQKTSRHVTTEAEAEAEAEAEVHVHPVRTTVGGALRTSVQPPPPPRARTREQEQRAKTRAVSESKKRKIQVVKPSFSQLCAMAKVEREAHPDDSDSDLTERLKQICARARFRYSTEELWKALDAVERRR